MQLRFDLHNHTERSSPDLEALYFYTGSGWIWTQDGKECSSASSDVDAFAKRHFLTLPVRRLAASGGWAQLIIDGRKVMALSFKGDKLKEEYTIAGTSLMRFVTSEGNLDFPVELNLKITESPF